MTVHYRKPVVVGIDGSRSAVEATRWAAVQAERREVPLRLVHAYEMPLGAPTGATVEDSILNATRDQARQWLGEARAAVAEITPQLLPETVLEAASVVAALKLESRTATMLVLGTRGRSGLLMGRPSITLAAEAHCPVVVVRGEPGGGSFGKGPVVVGVDGTPASESAIGFAFEEASIRGVELVAVHAWAFSPVETALTGGGSAEDFEPQRQQANETLAERLAGWREKYPDVEVVREVVRDRPTRALLRSAQDAQLLVVGSRGRGAVRSLVLGSTSRRLLRQARCPVAVARNTE